MTGRTCLISVVLLALPAAPATAETWDAKDRRRDVGSVEYVVPDVPPAARADDCDGPRERRAPRDKLRDITHLTVAHGVDAVDLTLALRATRKKRDRTTFYTLHLRTPERGYYVMVHRLAPGGEITTFFAKEPDYPDPEETGSCTISTLSTSLPCPGLAARIERTPAQVSVSLPRTCLDEPAWVEVGANVNGSTDPDASGRFTSFYDRWAPRGTDEGGFLPPYGPRVRSS